MGFSLWSWTCCCRTEHSDCILLPRRMRDVIVLCATTWGLVNSNISFCRMVDRSVHNTVSLGGVVDKGKTAYSIKGLRYCRSRWNSGQTGGQSRTAINSAAPGRVGSKPTASDRITLHFKLCRWVWGWMTIKLC